MLPPVEERIVQLMEREDQWFRALFGALTHQERIAVPGDVEVPRPGERKIPVKKVTSDTRAIAAWFSMFGA